jgi:RNA polymerase sigma factor (sigma-70 family)
MLQASASPVGRCCNILAACFVITVDDSRRYTDRAMTDWTEIERAFGPVVWRTAYRILRDHADASDCYQDVFFELFEKLKSTERVGASLCQWVATRRAIDRLRRRRNAARRSSGSIDVDSVVDTTQGPEQDLETAELVDAVRIELGNMPENQAGVFWLRYVEQQSYEEIATNLGVDKNHVGVLLHRARSHLKKSMADARPNRPG